MIRADGRKLNEMRPVKITPNYIMHAEGSVLIEVGETKVICSATVEEKVPPFLKGQGKGWVTAEYGMLPRATQTRNAREAARGKLSGRTYEIQRLIGRSLRSVVDLHALGERTIWLDCDVIQADGGTRTASITGAFVAMVLAVEKLMHAKLIEKMPILDFLAATSVGKVDDYMVLDLCYVEDSRAEVDMNIVMTGAGKFVEVQGTAEETPFTRPQLNGFLDLAEQGINDLFKLQRQILGKTSEQIGS